MKTNVRSGVFTPRPDLLKSKLKTPTNFFTTEPKKLQWLRYEMDFIIANHLRLYANLITSAFDFWVEQCFIISEAMQPGKIFNWVRFSLMAYVWKSLLLLEWMLPYFLTCKFLVNRTLSFQSNESSAKYANVELRECQSDINYNCHAIFAFCEGKVGHLIPNIH